MTRTCAKRANNAAAATPFHSSSEDVDEKYDSQSGEKNRCSLKDPRAADPEEGEYSEECLHYYDRRRGGYAHRSRYLCRPRFANDVARKTIEMHRFVYAC
jgi:hypothetical protein